MQFLESGFDYSRIFLIQGSIYEKSYLTQLPCFNRRSINSFLFQALVNVTNLNLNNRASEEETR